MAAQDLTHWIYTTLMFIIWGYRSRTSFSFSAQDTTDLSVHMDQEVYVGCRGVWTLVLHQEMLEPRLQGVPLSSPGSAGRGGSKVKGYDTGISNHHCVQSHTVANFYFHDNFMVMKTSMNSKNLIIVIYLAKNFSQIWGVFHKDPKLNLSPSWT